MAQRVPGIIVRVENDTGTIAPPIFERYPVYIGMGDPFKVITNREIVRSLGSVDAIPTVTTIEDIISVGDLPGISMYLDTTDYTLFGNNISWSPGGSKPVTGESFFITYTETRPASAFVPTLYFDENLIISDHGNKTRVNGSINDVVVAGSLGLNMGAGGVIVAQLNTLAAADPDNPTPTELENAFIAVREQLKGITDYKLYLVPMSSGALLTTTAADIFFAHAVLCSQPENKQERTVVMALAKGMTVAQFAIAAQAYSHERMIVPAVPDATVTVTGFATTQDTRFYNAAVVGKFCSVPIGRNISDEIISGITFSSNFTPAELKFLVQRGVSPAKIRGTVVRNVMFITTDTTSALTEDAGVQEVKDYVKKYWREGLWGIYKNAPMTPQLPIQVKSSSISILRQLIADSVIAEYQSISTSQSGTEPRTMNVSGKIKPAFGLQWMDVVFTFVLSF